MRLIGALLCSPEPVIWPHSEPELSIPCPLPSYFLKIHFTFTFPYKTRSSKVSLSLRFFCLNPVWTSFPCTTHGPLHSSWFDCTVFGEEWGRQSLWNVLWLTVTSSLLGPNIFLNTLFLKTFRLCSSLRVTPSLTPVQNNWQNYFSLCLNLHILE
jgi:hypothetical protein